jgi:hypothetical protein
LSLDWRTARNAFLGFLAGIGVWILLSPPYGRFLTWGAETAIRSFESRPVVDLDFNGTHIRIRRPDLRGAPNWQFTPTDETLNFILLVTLFAANPRPLSGRNLGRLLLSTLILIPTHLLGVIVQVMALYATGYGEWSVKNYSPVEQDVWRLSSHSYRLVLMYAIAFGLWFVLRPQEPAPEEVTEPRPKSPRKRKR